MVKKTEKGCNLSERKILSLEKISKNSVEFKITLPAVKDKTENLVSLTPRNR